MATKLEKKEVKSGVVPPAEKKTRNPMYDDKPGRLIIRNLQYDIKKKHLQLSFNKFGQIVDINVPLNNENNLNRGYGFVEFKTKEEARKAIDGMNGKTYKGRVIAVDHSVSQRQYRK